MDSGISDFSNMFTVMPMSQRFLLTPGETYEGAITVVNPADAKEDFEYKVQVTPYGVVGTDYAADLATVTNQSQIVDWITIENPTGKLKPNGYAQVKFKITVPETAAGGGQYATLAVSSNMNLESTGGVTVGNVFEMASIIYAQVEGEISHEGSVDQNAIPSYVAEMPLKTSIHLTNNGNVHETAKITLKVTNMFTGETLLAEEDELGTSREVIMPGTERYISEEIADLPLFGMVHVEQKVYYLGGMSTEMANVMICPIWFLLLMVVTVGAVVATIVRAIFKHKRKKAELAV